MSGMNANDARGINQHLFEQIARFECEASADTRTHIPCRKPATKVVEWRHQDGDHEHRLLCTEHAFEELGYWDTMEWDAGAEMSDIEDWQLGIRYAGRTATRVGSRYWDAAA